LCFRIRSINTPGAFKANEIFMADGSIRKDFKQFIKRDYDSYCRGCNWTCMQISSMYSKNQISFDDVTHIEKRR